MQKNLSLTNLEVRLRLILKEPLLLQVNLWFSIWATSSS